MHLRQKGKKHKVFFTYIDLLAHILSDKWEIHLQELQGGLETSTYFFSCPHPIRVPRRQAIVLKGFGEDLARHHPVFLHLREAVTL